HRPPTSTLFPYTTLFRSASTLLLILHACIINRHYFACRPECCQSAFCTWCDLVADPDVGERTTHHYFMIPTAGAIRVKVTRLNTDRKSTRLNSSHVSISY